MATSILIMTLTLLIASFLTALPLLRLRQTRAALQGTLGSLLVVAGCGALVALSSGWCADMDSASAYAADSDTKDVNKELPAESPAENPLPETSPPASSSAEESSPEAKLPEGQLHSAPNVHPDRVIIPPGRPEWVGHNVTVGSEHSIAVCSGPYSTEAEADRELDRLLKANTDEYIAAQLGSSLAPQLIRYDLPKIKRELVRPKNVYHEQIGTSLGPMQQIHAKIEFGPDFRQRITSQWHDWTAHYRLLQTGLIVGGALLFVGTIFSYFRLDNATRGYYTGRLQFMTAAAILAIAGSGAVLARWIYWL